mgnify:CR=1 FL=1
MKLILSDEQNLLNEDFIEWIIFQLKLNFHAKLNPKKLEKWDEYLNTSDDIPRLYNIPLSSKKILTEGIDNLTYHTLPQKYVIQIDSNKLVFGLNLTKLESICKLINYGNSSMTGYPIFTELFSEIEENFSQYIDRYVYGGL